MIRCKLCYSKIKRCLYEIGKYNYYYCQKCITLFLHPLPKTKSIDQLYRSFLYKNGLIEKNRIISRSKIILKNLLSLNRNGNTLLDIGSGYGFFLREANKKGLTTVGIEPSKTLSVQSIKHIKNPGKILNMSFNKFYLKNKNKKYDFITLIHVLEHIPEPYKIIQQALKLLNPLGVLYIETPNLNSHLYNSEKANYIYLTPPDHIWLFSKTSFYKIINSYKLLTTTYSYPEHMMGILKNKFKIKNFKFKNQKLENTKKNLLNNSKIDFKLKISNLKFRLLDRFIAPILTPLLNLGGYGSILELYIKKK